MSKNNKVKNANSKRISASRDSEDITTTSIAFKTHIISGLKAHPLHTDQDRSVSWIINKLSEKFLAGDIVIE